MSVIIKLLGTDSMQCPMNLRLRVWEKLASQWKSPRLERLVRTITRDGPEETIRSC